MTCNNCGHNNSPGAIYCGVCGAHLTEDGAPSLALGTPAGARVGSIPRRDLGDLVGETFRVYGAHFWPFFFMALVAQAPSLVNTLSLPAPLAVLLVLASFVLSILAGGAFGYLVLFPVMAGFFINLGVSGNMLPLLSANALFGFLLRTLLGCAIVFEWPVVVFFLARMGILTARTMLRGFRYAVLAIFVIAAVVTPTPDMATQTILALPMLGLYALGILIAWVVQPRKK